MTHLCSNLQFCKCFASILDQFYTVITHIIGFQTITTLNKYGIMTYIGQMITVQHMFCQALDIFAHSNKHQKYLSIVRTNQIGRQCLMRSYSTTVTTVILGCYLQSLQAQIQNFAFSKIYGTSQSLHQDLPSPTFLKLLLSLKSEV